MKPRVLLVEDEPEIRDLVAGWLREGGFLPVVAGSLREGEEFLAAGLWDLALVDLNLPDGRGTGLVRRAADFGIPALVLTGSTTAEEARECLRTGARDLLTKPVERARLLDVARSACPPFAPSEDRYGVLVVEDDPELARLIQTQLAQIGFDPVWTADPEEALRLAEGRAFPVILSDFKLPKMDGLQFIERASARIRPRPFTVLMTGFGSVERAVDAAKRGVDEYLEKPFAPGALRALVERGVQRALWSRLPDGISPGRAYVVTGGGAEAWRGLLATVRRTGLRVAAVAWGASISGDGRAAVDLSQGAVRAGLTKLPRAALQEALPGLRRSPGVVVLEAWEPMRAELGFDAALRVVQGLRELAEAGGCLGLVPAERSSFSETEWSRFTTGLYLLDLSGPEGKAERWRRTRENLPGDDRALFDAVAAAGGQVLQSDLVQNLGMSKAKVTRVLNRLEANGLLERRREGMGNRVVLK